MAAVNTLIWQLPSSQSPSAFLFTKPRSLSPDVLHAWLFFGNFKIQILTFSVSRFCFARFDPVFNTLKNIVNLMGWFAVCLPPRWEPLISLVTAFSLQELGLDLKKRISRAELYDPTLNISILSDRSSGVYALWEVSSFPPRPRLCLLPTDQRTWIFVP